MTTPPQANKAEILKALPYLLDPADVIELRAIHRGSRKRTDAGYFDSAHWPALADAAVSLNNQGAAVYVSLNPVDQQLLSRYHNRVQQYAPESTTDNQIIRRRWLPIDVDPQRPAKTSATQKQLELAAVKATAIRKFLLEEGWSACAVANSGNGMHLLYAIDLPNDEASKKLIEGVLKALAARFDDEAVKVDRSVFNAARIWKLYGTVANKGDHTEPAPWRLSYLSDQFMPSRALVTVAQLQALAPPAEPVHTPRGLDFGPFNSGKPFDVEDFMQRHGLEHTKDLHDGLERFKLKECPFNPEHKNGEAAIFRKSGGALAFKCMHNSCADKDWRAVREHFEGPRILLATFPRIVNPDTGEIEADTDWPEPQPLPSDLPAVAAFDPDLLPESLRGWVMDISDRMQCPPDFPAVGALVALSSLIGPRVLIAPKKLDTWTVTPNLWGLIVGNPGVMKSPALGESLAPLQKKEAELRELWEAERAQWLLDKKASELAAEAGEQVARKALKENAGANVAHLLKAEPPPAEPTLRRLIVNDTNAAALGEVLEVNPWGVLAYRDELYGLLKSMDREGNENDRTFYLQGFDGDKPYTFDRIGRGLNRHIKRVCISMLGSIQPGRLMEYVRGAVAGGSGDDGLVQRFQLAVWPDMPKDWRNVDRAPDAAARTRALAVYDRLATLSANEDRIPIWRFDAQAQAIFDSWREALEPRLRTDELHPAMAAHLSKYRKLVPSLTLIFALVDDPDSDGEVSAQHLARALAWAEYLETHAARIYAAAMTPESAGARALLRRIKDGAVQATFTPREVYRNGWQHLNTPESARRACEVLAEFHWLKPAAIGPTDAGGRPSAVYLVNPQARPAA